MEKFLRSVWFECFLYILLCVFVFAASNLLCGWLARDYDWIYKDNRMFIAVFALMNFVVDYLAILIIYIHRR
jgi:hypothetical protein